MSIEGKYTSSVIDYLIKKDEIAKFEIEMQQLEEKIKRNKFIIDNQPKEVVDLAESGEVDHLPTVRYSKIGYTQTEKVSSCGCIRYHYYMDENPSPMNLYCIKHK